MIYLDHNATTPVHPEVVEAMAPYWRDSFGNPSSSHACGRAARRGLESARESIAGHLDARPDEVIFTSGATEANNLALLGLGKAPPGTLLSSPIEHPCVVEPLRQLAQLGYAWQTLPVSAEGVVDADAPLPSELALVSLMLANHETGALQPAAALGSRIPETTAFHCDAAAAAGKIPISFRSLGVTALTISAHKFQGPKGVGALLLRREARLRPLFRGGSQQQARRPGTEPVALAVGMARALELSLAERETRTWQMQRLRERLLSGLRQACSPVVLNGPAEGGLPHVLNLSFPGVKADLLLMRLDLAGVACSTGSACSSGSLLPSPVLTAMGVPAEVLTSAMRFSLGPEHRDQEIDEAVARISSSVLRLRQEADDLEG